MLRALGRFLICQRCLNIPLVSLLFLRVAVRLLLKIAVRLSLLFLYRPVVLSVKATRDACCTHATIIEVSFTEAFQVFFNVRDPNICFLGIQAKR